MHGVRGGLEPDSGNPTVRDHWGALGNTTMEELGTRSTIERVETETLFLRCCAPSFYPDRSCVKTPKSHQRELVDGSDSAYKGIGFRNLGIPPTGSWWMVQIQPVHVEGP